MHENKSLIGRCGLYCGGCKVYLASHGQDELKEEIAQKHSCRAEDIFCDGCQGDHDKCWCIDKNWGRNCAIIECQNNRGINYCIECDAFSECNIFNELANHYIKKGQDLKKNLIAIKKDAQAWLESQDKNN